MFVHELLRLLYICTCQWENHQLLGILELFFKVIESNASKKKKNLTMFILCGRVNRKIQDVTVAIA